MLILVGRCWCGYAAEHFLALGRVTGAEQYVTNLYQSEETRMGGTRNNCHI